MFSRRRSSSKFTFPIVPFNQEIKDFLNVIMNALLQDKSMVKY